MIGVIVSALALAAAIVGAPRWLRIAQREHYIAGSVTRFRTSLVAIIAAKSNYRRSAACEHMCRVGWFLGRHSCGRNYLPRSATGPLTQRSH